MASNKWLNDLKTLKSTTNTLRNTLRNKNVAAYDTDTLQTLVSKVPNLAPIEYSELEKWQPDPLWKFPDPNGSGEMKTIRQIYDEDTMASSYTYRGIYMIRGDLDTIDLKAIVGSRTNSDTFILSDGATYTNVTTNTLEHTWDKTKDVVDSVGNVVRYIKIYTSTAVSYVPGVYRRLIWAIHNLGTTLTTSKVPYAECIMELPYECLEVEDKVTSTKGVGPMGQPRRLCFKDTSTSNLPSDPYLFARVKWLELPKLSSFSNANLLQYSGIEELDCSNATGALTFDIGAMCNLRRIIFPQKCTTVTMSNTAAVRGSSSYRLAGNNKYLTLNLPDSVTSATLYDLLQEDFYVPSNIKSMTAYYCYMKSLELPEGMTSLTMHYCGNISRIEIPSTITSLSLSQLRGLRDVVLPENFNVAASFSNCTSISHDSLVDMLTKLKDLTDTTSKKLSLGSVLLNTLTAEEKAIATNKNWTLS